MLKAEDTVLIVIDVQGRLAHLMHQKEILFENIQKMITGAKVLDIPIIWAEQIPEKLGDTIPDIKELLHNFRLEPFPKNCFSCIADESILKKLQSLKRKQVLLVGIETHVCIYQTAMDLLELNYEVQVVADAVSSRTLDNKVIGLERMKSMGVAVSSVEMILFELLKVAEGAKFKDIMKIVK